MPIYPPRNEPIKKKEQLAQRQQELKQALINKLTAEKLDKAAEKYRLAQLSLLKAKVHEFRERQYQNKPRLTNLESLEKEILIWTNKPVREVIKEVEIEL
jgi:hypothetical protein